MMRGPIHGYLVSQLGDATEDKTKFGWTVFAGAAETIIGGVAAQRLSLTSGRAELTGVGGDIGLGTGFAIADQLQLDERRRQVTVTSPFGPPYNYLDNDRTLQSTVVLAGTGLGLVGGYLLGRTEEWTRGDAVIFRNVTAMGGLAGIAAGDVIQQPKLITEQVPNSPSYSYYQDDFSRVHSAAGLLGTAGGVLLGRALVTGRNFTTGQGTMLTLAPLAGGLIGLGIAYLATPDKPYNYAPGTPYRDPNDHSELYLGMSTLGAAAGFAAMYPAMARQSRGASAASFEFTVNPLAAAQLLRRGRGRVVLGGLQYRF
jgi:hypothetical protein